MKFRTAAQINYVCMAFNMIMVAHWLVPWRAWSWALVPLCAAAAAYSSVTARRCVRWARTEEAAQNEEKRNAR